MGWCGRRPHGSVENSILIAEAELGAAREYILAQLEKLEKAGVRTRQVVRIGSPIDVILDVVEEEKAKGSATCYIFN